ncbi:MAG TPA: hypothetical protein GYA05_05780 [Acholeplasmataceae bacterium]|nr:hypothetical protein [Acholeplasmataceae bacterium]
MSEKKREFDEKKLTLIVAAVAFLAILVVILFNIPWGGDKAKIKKEYESLESNDHVFVSITYQELIRKIENNETFQLYIGSGDLPQANHFVYVANELAKERGIDKIYYLRSSELSSLELDDIKGRSSHQLSLPTLMYWISDETESVAPFISSLKKFEDYHRNWSILLSEYFEECYQ